VKKLIYLVCMSVLAFSLAGCLGGGGGGSGGGSSASPFLSGGAVNVVMPGGTRVGDVTDVADPGQVGTLAALLTQPGGMDIGGGLALREEGSLQLVEPATNTVLLTVETGPDKDVFLTESLDGGRYLMGKVAPADKAISEYIGGLLTSGTTMEARKYNDEFTHGSSTEKFTGEVRHEANVVILNDNKNGVPLEYSNFGAWALYSHFDGTFTLPGKTVDVHDIYTNGVHYFGPDTGKPSDLAYADVSLTGATFTGKAMGEPFAHDKMPAGFIFGDASLTISSATQANLALSFPGYYNIAINDLTLNAGGPYGITGNVSDILVTDKGADAKGFGLGGIVSGGGAYPAVGNFYGPASNTPTEAVGKFKVESSTTGNGIQGSWGVKKQ
jgi:hypothetical protein